MTVETTPATTHLLFHCDNCGLDYAVNYTALVERSRYTITKKLLDYPHFYIDMKCPHCGKEHHLGIEKDGNSFHPFDYDDIIVKIP